MVGNFPWLLRARCERPRSRRAAKHTEKFAPPHLANPRHHDGETIALWRGGTRGFQSIGGGGRGQIAAEFVRRKVLQF